jgi:hypothetical protein
LIYFFANQIPLLEFTNLEGAVIPAPTTSAPAAAPPAKAPAHFNALVGQWARYQSSFQSGLHPGDEAARKKIQVVAWSDPSDLLTWRVPAMAGVNVVNLYVRNATHWFWLVESPTGAHDNYANNKDVLRVMFLNTDHRGGH